MNQFLASAWLAYRDWLHEHLLSLCAVLALASMLAPILVLLGVKNGVIDGMRERLLEDPTVLIITPKSDAGRYSAEFINELKTLPGASYVIGRTRDTSTDITLANPAKKLHASIAFEPATEGEPVLGRFRLDVPANSPEPEVILSSPAASALGAAPGDTLEARVGRRTPAGKLESTTISLHVKGVLPIEAADKKMAFASLGFLEDMENYRDYIAVPSRGMAGNPARGSREYASFRLYAANLESVETLAQILAGKQIEVITKAREIASIRLLENAINSVILIISIAVGTGFAAFTISSVQGAVSRKKKMLGMLRLLGFKKLPLMCYPLVQTLLTAILGFVLSLLVYWLVSLCISHAFAGNGAFSCHLGPLDIFLALAAVIGLSTLACLRAAWQASAVEPSIVIRNE